MKLEIYLCLLFGTLCVSWSSAQNVKRATFGENCNRTHRCDSKASLTCDDGVCDCVMAETMIFEVSLDKCVTISGERCVYTAVEVGASSEETETKKWREQLECVPQATCSSDGFCVCSEGYFETLNGTCEEKRDHGAPCFMDAHCKKHLICNSDTMQCDCNGLTAFDISRNKCVGRVGSLCKEYPECIPNAVCPSKPTESYQEYDRYYGNRWKTRTLEYTSQTCACNDGYSSTPDMKFCLAKHGKECGYDDVFRRCYPGLICQEGKCSCKFESHQTYDSTLNKCASFVGGPCTNETDVCMQNANCVGVQGIDETGVCECQEGLIEVNRKCEIAYGEKCGPGVRLNAKCDTVAPLHCIEGTCKCKTLEYYDSHLKTCRGLEGALCYLNTSTSTNYFCLDGATCGTFRNLTGGVGRCTCKEGFQPTTERKCLEVVPVTTVFPWMLSEYEKLTTIPKEVVQPDAEEAIFLADSPANKTSEEILVNENEVIPLEKLLVESPNGQLLEDGKQQ